MGHILEIIRRGTILLGLFPLGLFPLGLFLLGAVVGSLVGVGIAMGVVALIRLVL